MHPPHADSAGPAACSARGPARALLRTSGFTLLEVVVTLLIASLTMGSLAFLTGTTSSATREISGNIGALREGIDAIAALRHDLGRCCPLEVSQDGLSLKYRLPVPAGPGGGFVDSSGEMIWGSSDSDGVHVGGSLTISFVKESELRESAEDRDMNGDGDKTDVFEVGHLARTTSGGQRIPLPKLTVVVAPTVTQVGQTGRFPADLDGDGLPDPLFEYDRAHEQLIVRVARFARAGRVRVLLIRSSMADVRQFRGG